MSAKSKGYKRSWKNLLLNKRYQLRFTLFMVIMSGVLMALLGWWVMSAAEESTHIGVNAIRDSRDCGAAPRIFRDMTPVKKGINLNNNTIDHRQKQKPPGALIEDAKIKIDPTKIKRNDDSKKKDDVKKDDVKKDDVKKDDVKKGDGKVAPPNLKAGEKEKKDKTEKNAPKNTQPAGAGDKTAVDKAGANTKDADKKDADKKDGDKKAAGDKKAGDKGEFTDDDDGDVADGDDDEEWERYKEKNKNKVKITVVLDRPVKPGYADKAIAFYICQLKQVRDIADVRGSQTTILWALIAVGVFLMAGLTLYGIKMTHRVAGPLHKVSLYFAKMRDEKYDKVWNLRKGDQLIEFYEHFKHAHVGLCEMQRADIEQLQAIIEVAEKQELASKSPELAAALDDLRELLKRKEGSFDN